MKNTAVKNRFSGIVDATRAREKLPQEELPKSPQSEQGQAKRKGKSSHPEFVQVSAYLRKETHRNARRLLLDDEQGRDLSDLMEELLLQWIDSR